MATRLFFHDAANALSGTFPTSEQSTVGTPTKSVSGATVLRTMGSLTGTAMVARSLSGSVTVAQQILMCGFFCSDPLDVDQQIPPQPTTLNIANRESSSNMNLGADLRAVAYVWRPSAGTMVGYITDGLVATGDAEPSTSLSIRVNNCSVTSTATVSAAAGDVIICEVWQVFTQSTANAFTGAFYYDGTTVNVTTNSTVTNHASFYELSTSTLTFQQPPITGTFSNTLATVALSATGESPKVGTFNNTLATVALSGVGAVPHTATFDNTLATVALSATGQVGVATGTFNNTLGAVTLSGAGAVPHTATFGNTLATVGLSATGAVPEVGTFNNALADVSLSATGEVIDVASAEGTFNNTLEDMFLLSATGLVVSAAEGTFDNILGRLSLVATGTGPIVRRPSDGGHGGSGASQRRKFTVPSEPELASPVDALFDHPPKPQAPPELSPTRVLKHDTMSLATAIASTAPVVPEQKITKLATVQPENEEYSDEDMIILAMLV